MTFHPHHIGVISLPVGNLHQWLRLDETSTQGELQNRGVFSSIHHHLQLPPSYTILAIFIDPMRPRWRIFVENENIPLLEQSGNYPELDLWYIPDEQEEGVRLMDIIVRYPQSAFPLADYLERFGIKESQGGIQ